MQSIEREIIQQTVVSTLLNNLNHFDRTNQITEKKNDRKKFLQKIKRRKLNSIGIPKKKVTLFDDT